jgi:DNA-binding response OmpR family regulator
MTISSPTPPSPDDRPGDPGSPASGHSIRVLLIEDDPDQAHPLQHNLTNYGLRCQCAHNGIQALDMLQTRPFDIIVIDLGVAALDGDSLTRRIRAIEPHATTPIIGISGKDNGAIRESALRSGMSEFIPKPFGIPRLIAVIEQWTGAKKL